MYNNQVDYGLARISIRLPREIQSISLGCHVKEGRYKGTDEYPRQLAMTEVLMVVVCPYL